MSHYSDQPYRHLTDHIHAPDLGLPCQRRFIPLPCASVLSTPCLLLSCMFLTDEPVETGGPLSHRKGPICDSQATIREGTDLQLWPITRGQSALHCTAILAGQVPTYTRQNVSSA